MEIKSIPSLISVGTPDTIIDRYYRLTPQPAPKDIPSTYVGKPNRYYDPFGYTCYGAFHLRHDFDTLLYKRASGFYQTRYGIPDEDIEAALVIYGEKFQLAFQKFEDAVVKRKSTLFNDRHDYCQTIFDYATNATLDSRGGYPELINSTEHVLSRWGEAGKIMGYVYRSWYIIFEHYTLFESFFTPISNASGSDSIPMSIQFPLPGDENEFESLVRDLYNKEYPQGSYQKFGKSGNNQKGIDILSIPKKEAIQCKKKEYDRKSLVKELEKEIKESIEGALLLKIPLSHLIIACTCPDNAALIEYSQTTASRLGASFSATYIGWDSLSEILRRHQELIIRYYGELWGLTPRTGKATLIISTTFLDNIPKIAYKAYLSAKALWDTGVTAEMIGGNEVWSSELFKILIQVANECLPPAQFEGQTASEFFNGKINALMASAYHSQPPNPGTMHIVMASGQRAQIIEEYIVQIVKSTCEPAFFEKWYPLWDKAVKGRGEDQDFGW